MRYNPLTQSIIIKYKHADTRTVIANKVDGVNTTTINSRPLRRCLFLINFSRRININLKSVGNVIKLRFFTHTLLT